METFIRNTFYQGEECVELCAGGYYALLAPNIGSSMLRLKDLEKQMEIFRFNENIPIDTIRTTPEIYGMPTLYLPNRLDGGVLKTSDAVYQLPITEKNLNNYIHGFLHKRTHTVTNMAVKGEVVSVTTQYIYDEKDVFFKEYPICFTVEITFTLSSDGLEQDFKITNNSDKKLPVGVCSHTTFSCPFSPEGKEEDLRLTVGVLEKWVLGERCSPTEEILPLTDYDLTFKNGTINPVTQSIDNDIYTGIDAEFKGRPFYGARISDIKTGKTICYETGKEFGFWIVWNEGGNKGYCCPEPMSWMINAPNLTLPAEKTGYTELSKGESWNGYQHIYTVID